MSSCERCWKQANLASRLSNAPVVETYRGLLKAREEMGHTECSPEDQAGPDRTMCQACGRRTCHQHTGECMACHKWWRVRL